MYILYIVLTLGAATYTIETSPIPLHKCEIMLTQAKAKLPGTIKIGECRYVQKE